MLRMDRLTGFTRIGPRLCAADRTCQCILCGRTEASHSEATPSLPADLQIGLRERELPAGIFIGIMMRVTGAGTEPTLSLACKETKSVTVRVQAGAENAGVKLQQIQTNTLFVSLDPAHGRRDAR